MPFSPGDLAMLAETEEVEIETRAAPDAAVHRTVIWIVTDGQDAFIRSVRGARGRWYREAVAHPDVAIHAAGHRFAARAVPASDPDSIERTSAGFSRKYAGDPAVRSVLKPNTLDTTLRVEPA